MFTQHFDLTGIVALNEYFRVVGKCCDDTAEFIVLGNIDRGVEDLFEDVRDVPRTETALTQVASSTLELSRAVALSVFEVELVGGNVDKGAQGTIGHPLCSANTC